VIPDFSGQALPVHDFFHPVQDDLMVKRLGDIVIGPQFQRVRGFLGPVNR
jgi:hypothetical protein